MQNVLYLISYLCATEIVQRRVFKIRYIISLEDYKWNHSIICTNHLTSHYIK
uniref:Uncharacterized protein n=1 Tax=Arundo donax TaxID=35708 RepID=A0A0A9U5P6_ARUDO